MKTDQAPYSVSELRDIVRSIVIGYLSRNIGHQINNNLTGIYGYCLLAQQSKKHPDKQQEYLKRIQECCEQAQVTISSLLTYSDAAVHQVKGPLSPLDQLKNIIDICDRLVQPRFAMHLDLEHSDGEFDLPSQAFHDLLLFLLVVTMRQANQGNIDIVCTPDSPFGNHESLQDIDPLYVAIELFPEESSEDETQIGLSLEPIDQMITEWGMQMAEMLASSWGGIIRHGDNEQGRFVIEVCFSRHSQTASAATGMPPAPERREAPAVLARAPRILVLEDQEIIRGFTETILEKEGYQTTSFESGLDLQNHLDRIEPNHYDLYLLDIYVPGVSGMDIAHLIRQKDPEAPILFYSALVDFETIEQQFGIDQRTQFLPKPFHKNELIALIRDCIVWENIQ